MLTIYRKYHFRLCWNDNVDGLTTSISIAYPIPIVSTFLDQKSTNCDVNTWLCCAKLRNIFGSNRFCFYFGKFIGTWALTRNFGPIQVQCPLSSTVVAKNS